MPSTPGRTRWLTGRPARRLGRASLLVVGLLLGMLVGELVVRIVGYEDAHARQGTLYASPYGVVPPDNWIFRLPEDVEAQSHLEIRGRPFPLAKPPDETRMLFIGDSGTAGLFVDIEHSFPLKLEALLDARDPGNGVSVINAGAVGMTTVGEYYLLRDKLQFLNPDIVVLGLFMANDINFILGHQERPDTRGTHLLDRLDQHSALFHFAHLRWLASAPRSRVWRGSPEVALTLVDRDGLHLLNDEAGEIATYVREPSELTNRAFGVLGNVLAEFLDLSRERGFAFAVVLVPTRSAVSGRLDLPHQPHMLEKLAEHGILVREEDLDFTLPTRRVLGLCEDLGIPCIDPTARMQQVGMGSFLPEDEHTSIAGHEALAQELLSHIDALLTRD